MFETEQIKKTQQKKEGKEIKKQHNRLFMNFKLNISIYLSRSEKVAENWRKGGWPSSHKRMQGANVRMFPT